MQLKLQFWALVDAGHVWRGPPESAGVRFGHHLVKSYSFVPQM